MQQWAEMGYLVLLVPKDNHKYCMTVPKLINVYVYVNEFVW